MPSLYLFYLLIGVNYIVIDLKNTPGSFLPKKRKEKSAGVCG